ncbi:NUDIX domain-containing protein [Massilia suwonensis]|uniref:NUDIX domain-containing protein n=1 Tax=Massilia suwonensis TaxID=648895 RepID=A0ABW0MV96_9BURK
MPKPPIRIVEQRTVFDGYYPLQKIRYAQRRADGRVQEQTREVYGSDSGVTALLYDRTRRTLLFTRQFRIGAHLAGHDGFLIETAAGVLEGADPLERIRAEIREELGYTVDDLRHVMTLFASPGTLTEQVHYFVGEYRLDDRCSAGGGKEAKARTSRCANSAATRPWTSWLVARSWTSRLSYCCNTCSCTS